MRAYHFDRHELDLPAGHRFPISKYRLLREAVRRDSQGLIELLPALPATDGELELAHDPAYLDAVVHGRLSTAQQREIGFPWSGKLVERSRHSVGATIAAARAALVDGIAAQLGGGTHHARSDSGSGFCVFNDVAVAARLMQAEAGRGPGRSPPPEPLRVLVVDLDVHQGNGTAAIFAGDASVFTLSLHGARNFPFRKVAGDLDVDLPDRCGDGEYLAALRIALAEAERRWLVSGPPGLAFYLAGADVHEGDRLGRLALTTAGIAERDRLVLDWLARRGIPTAVTMAGGYGHAIEQTVAIHLQTLKLAAAVQAGWRSDRRNENPAPDFQTLTPPLRRTEIPHDPSPHPDRAQDFS